MPIDAPDPRIFFAAERTLLAWLRTGVGIMVFGFVVARFGMLLRLIEAQGRAPTSPNVSPHIGAALVVLGVVAIAAGTLEYRRFCQRLRPEDLPSPLASLFPMVLAWTLVGLGVALATVLLP